MAGRTVKIAIVGDEGVGKSSLVLAAVHNIFNEDPVPTLPPTRLPPDSVESYMSPAPATLILDTCSRPEEKQAWELNVQEAHAIILTFAANDFETLRRVAMHWMPELARVGVKNTPIILTACKSDVGDIRAGNFHDLIQAILTEYKHIETFLETSAKKQQSVPDTFYYAIKSVVHPAEPLVEFSSAALRPLCVKALKRIFLLCDSNEDGILDDEELNNFQVKCFNAPLQPTELAGVKHVVGDRLSGGLNQNGLTLKGFLFLHALFIEKARTETVWTVLRAFGYDNDLLIEDRWLDEVSFKCQPDQVVELSSEAKAFLQSQFSRYDANQDSCLSKPEQDELFSASPSCAFDEEELQGIMVQNAGSPGLTQKGFMSKWAYLTMTNPRTALAHLLYIGIPLDKQTMQQQFNISRPRSIERKKPRDQQCRTVFQCFVFGDSGAGKTSLIEGLLRQEGQEAEQQPQEAGSPRAALAPKIAVNEVIVSRDHRGRQHQVSATLVLQEIQPRQVAQIASDPARFLQPCDMAAFVYDSSSRESLHAALDLLAQLTDLADDTLPCVLIAANDVMSTSKDVQPELAQFVQDMGVQVPSQISANTNDSSPVYSTLVEAAMTPAKYIPQTPNVKARQQQGRFSSKSTLLLAATAVAVVGMYGLWRFNSQDVRSEELQRRSKREAAGVREHVNGAKAYMNGLVHSWSRT